MIGLEQLGQQAKEASIHLSRASTKDRNEGLTLIAKQLLEEQEAILKANEEDLLSAEQNQISKAVMDRIRLTPERIKAISDGLLDLVELPDPIGRELDSWTLENGIQLSKVAVPIGVVGIIYEARPNVTVDAAALCLKSGNAVLLRGSSSAIHSNIAIVKAIRSALEQSNMPINSVQLLEDTSRKTAEQMFKMNKYLDVLIPRGSQRLIDTVIEKSSIPVLETGAGNCHMYVDQSADSSMAIQLVINAKTQRPSVCNAIETVLIHKDWFYSFGKDLIDALKDHHVELRGDQQVVSIDPSIKNATEDDWNTEYLDMILAMKIVNSVEEAIEHINHYGTSHSEAIVTTNPDHAVKFLNEVDAACVYHNASTRFTDGFEFGFGAEIGISTQKLHARGPMGLEALTSTKYKLSGEGQYKK
ncbi:glutamate-5-semialdehyde dehydrogenase [Amphibacillus xylanus]|uniref:Gamma-glutamyl phosphate reductase n=1 Tax=Amphibacillus xylanus (strain ATCC 51415 / DSM 6626 / JCM 7361 / LMG 17667 / NBRC 15112 / Ep01) TaxID=698758 RepID=K0J7J3_AMPXN|nr:glutamate-5-semialdehyde dehydrogenase [Amphibacillus xylanus]BAM47468.1 gamma-glutamyl phosphate reductase [Amphibacillus xylanus NBRC 15112]